MGQRLAEPTTGKTYQRADPLPRSITLEIPRGLLASLRDLTTGIDGDGNAVGELLDALIRELETAVASYRGLQLTISQNGFPVVLTAYPDGHDRAVGTSLRVPLTLLDSGFTTESRIVFYAGTPGAFVDLAADLTFALRGASTPDLVENSAPPAIRLDADPPPRTRGFNLSGLTELSAIDRAVGVMIDQGRHPDRAHASLRNEAAPAGMEPYTWALRILQGTRTPLPSQEPVPDHPDA
jgi:hypothetical protein